MNQNRYPTIDRGRLAQWTHSLRRLVARRMGREASADEGLLVWGSKMLPAHFRRPPSTMHRWLAGQLDGLQGCRGMKINIIGPRGGAKSTLVTLAYVLRAALEGWEPYIWVVSDTRHQANAHLENIKAELAGNRQLAERYGLGGVSWPVWRANVVELPNRVRIEALGVGQRLRGKRHGAARPSLIVCDDLQNDSHMESAHQRARSDRWFEGSLLKAGTPQTHLINLATALHRDALALQLDRTPGWTSRTFRAIEHWPDNMTLWLQWQAVYANMDDPDRQRHAREFYLERQEAMDAGTELLWPEEESLYALMCMRVEGGAVAFEREKQGSPANPDLYEWPDDYFDREIWFDEWPSELAIKTIALDPSKGRDAQVGDYSAFVLLGVDVTGTLYVEADLARRPIAQIVSDGVAHCQQFQPDGFGIEVNQFQELLGDQFALAFRAAGAWAIAPWSIENRINKKLRIRRLGAHLARRQLRFKNGSPGTALLVEQLREFPVGDHDDGPDALEMAIRLADELSRGTADDGLGDRLPVGR
jgi:predicted phage terminase large subunit-like protein